MSHPSKTPKGDRSFTFSNSDSNRSSPAHNSCPRLRLRSQRGGPGGLLFHREGYKDRQQQRMLLRYWGNRSLDSASKPRRGLALWQTTSPRAWQASPSSRQGYWPLLPSQSTSRHMSSTTRAFGQPLPDFPGPKEAVVLFPAQNLSTGTPKDGFYTTRMLLLPANETGDWNLVNLTLVDREGNRKILQREDLQRLGLPTVINVI